jgi:hypothetical protein
MNDSFALEETLVLLKVSRSYNNFILFIKTENCFILGNLSRFLFKYSHYRILKKSSAVDTSIMKMVLNVASVSKARSRKSVDY